MAFIDENVKQIELDELKEILNQKQRDILVIDVREPEEYEEYHIPGIPLIPMHRIPTFVNKLKKNSSYIFVCRSGNRSQQVALFLKKHGITQAFNFNGGMLAWDGEIATGLGNAIATIDDLYKK